MTGRRFMTRLLLVVASAGIWASPVVADPASTLLAPSGACGVAADQLGLKVVVARRTMLCLTNWARVHAGLEPLTQNRLLDRAAAAKLRADVACREFSHTPCGTSLQVVFAPYLSGATEYTIGENMAWGTGVTGTPRQTMNEWLHSPDHLRNILSREFEQIGIGYIAGQTFQGTTHATLWSQDFGARSPARQTRHRET